MKIYVGCDHAGFELKKKVCDYLKNQNYDLEECIAFEFNCEDDFVDAAFDVSNKVSNDENSKGILICGTGIGMSIAANRNNKIRAALCHNVEEAKLSRLHNDANILCLGGRMLNHDEAIEIVKNFLETNFSNIEKYTRRNERLK